MTSDHEKYPIQTIFQRFYPMYFMTHPDLPENKQKTAAAIANCKTGKLGYDISTCEKCGHIKIHAVSCNNRSCPCCQAPLAKKWENERNTEMIEGLAYYHVVFTLPHECNRLFPGNMTLLLNLFFKCVQETLLTLCADPRFMGAKPGIISVLHTWGQKLNFHPHIHVCISGGGITPAGKFVETKHKGFFMPEAVIASMFRGKFLCRLKELYNEGRLDLSNAEYLQDVSEWKKYIDSLFEKRWLPFVKETFNGKGNAIRYLARYSYRTAIANSRIVSVDKDTVTFRYKDYADKNKEKTLTVRGVEFIDMYLQHILDSGFHRFRFSGYLANRKRTDNLKLIHRLRSTIYTGNPYRKMKMVELIKVLYGTDLCSCPLCNGKMITVSGRPRAKPPTKRKITVWEKMSPFERNQARDKALGRVSNN